MTKKPAKLIEFVPVGKTSGHEIRVRSIVLKDGALSIRMCYQNGAKKKAKRVVKWRVCSVALEKQNKPKFRQFFD